ncbi:MAG: transglutaminase domain-containing protein, partial [Pseudomonadota bacterium]
RDHVDDFLFDTRRGFCEHYAAAFTVLMWAADIPARVVTGYQGGESNPFGFITVRQRDAHAWTEVWISDEIGWQRIDPTSAVSPDRIERGIDSALPFERFNPLGFQFSTNSPLFKAWEQVRFGWDALNSSWDQWVLGYGAELQGDLMTYLGLRAFGYRGLLIALLITLATLISLVALWLFWHQPRRRREPLQAQYERFCHKLAREGVERQPSEGPLDLAERIRATTPELWEKAEFIITLYVQMRYRTASRQELKEIRLAISQFP